MEQIVQNLSVLLYQKIETLNLIFPHGDVEIEPRVLSWIPSNGLDEIKFQPCLYFDIVLHLFHQFDLIESEIKSEEQFSNLLFSENRKLFDLIFTCVSKNLVFNQSANGNILILVEIDNPVFELFDSQQKLSKIKLQNLLQKQQFYDNLTKLLIEFDFNEQMLPLIVSQDVLPQYGIISTEGDQFWKHIFDALFVSYLQKPLEQWKIFRVYEGLFPNDEEMNAIKGYVITGSHDDAYDNKLIWISACRNWIEKVLSQDQYKTIKLFGVCFGHQIIAHAFKGKCEKMPHMYEAFRKEKINLSEAFFDIDFVKRSPNYELMKKHKQIICHESHCDHVSQLPKGGISIGSSESCKEEMFYIPDRVFSTQFHPEFNEFIMRLSLKRMEKKKSQYYEELLEQYQKTNSGTELDNSFVIEIARNFLEN